MLLLQASDVAISQFRFLVPLLYCHGRVLNNDVQDSVRTLHRPKRCLQGRRAYRRVATFICYMFYKHTTLAVGDIFYAHQIGLETRSKIPCSHLSGFISRFVPQIAYAEWLNSALEPQAT